MKIEIDTNKMSVSQWNKLDKSLRKYVPFKAIKVIDEELKSKGD